MPIGLSPGVEEVFRNTGIEEGVARFCQQKSQLRIVLYIDNTDLGVVLILLFAGVRKYQFMTCDHEGESR